MTYQGRDCADCSVTVVADDLVNVENYMVRDDVWKAAGMDYLDGFLCVSCLESRIGRPLTAADLNPTMPINYPGQQRDTPRLFRLKSEAWGVGLLNCWCGERFDTWAEHSLHAADAVLAALRDAGWTLMRPVTAEEEAQNVW